MDFHHGGVFCANEDAPPSNPSTSARPRAITGTSGCIHHGHYTSWKLIRADVKKYVFRYDGVCKDDPKYNVHSVNDPRNRLSRFKITEPADLAVPLFEIDNNSVGPSPRREVSIYGLNDNVNHTFLEDVCGKIGSVLEALVYRHPRTNKHLGMGFVLFKRVEAADAFIAKYNNGSIMGQEVTCFHDSFAAIISQRFEEITCEAAPLPRYLRHVSREKLEILRNGFLNRKQSFPVESPAGQAESTSIFKDLFAKVEPSQALEADIFARTGLKNIDSPITPYLSSTPAETLLDSRRPHSPLSLDVAPSTPSIHLGTPSTSSVPLSTPSPRVDITCAERHHSSVLPPPPAMPFDLMRPSTSACSPAPPPLPVRAVPYFLRTAPPPPIPIGFQRPSPMHLPPQLPFSPSSLSMASVRPSESLPPPLPPPPPSEKVWPCSLPPAPPPLPPAPPPPPPLPPTPTKAVSSIHSSSTLQSAELSDKNHDLSSLGALGKARCLLKIPKEENDDLISAVVNESRKYKKRHGENVSKRGESIVSPSSMVSRYRKRKHSSSSSCFSTSGAETISDEDSTLSSYQKSDLACVEKCREKKKRRGKAVVEKRKYLKIRGPEGSKDYYKEVVIRTLDDTKERNQGGCRSPEVVRKVESYQRIREYKMHRKESSLASYESHEADELEPGEVDLPDLKSVSSEEDDPRSSFRKADGFHCEGSPPAVKEKHEICKGNAVSKNGYSKYRHGFRKGYYNAKNSASRNKKGVRGAFEEEVHRWSSSSEESSSDSVGNYSLRKQVFRNSKRREVYTKAGKRTAGVTKREIKRRDFDILDMAEAVSDSSSESGSNVDRLGKKNGLKSKSSASLSKSQARSQINIASSKSAPSFGAISPMYSEINPSASSLHPLRPSIDQRLESLLCASLKEPADDQCRISPQSSLGTPQVPSTPATCDNSPGPAFLPADYRRTPVMENMPCGNFSIGGSLEKVTSGPQICASRLPFQFPLQRYVSPDLTQQQDFGKIMPSEHMLSMQPPIPTPDDDFEKKLVTEEEEKRKEEEARIALEKKEAEEREVKKKEKELEYERKMRLREAYLHAMFETVFTEMSGLLIKDVSRKVEFIAFEKLEEFWAEKDKKALHLETSSKGVTSSAPPISSSRNSLGEMFRQVAAQSKAEMTAALGQDVSDLLGTDFLYSLGSYRNLPSFKKKNVKTVAVENYSVNVGTPCSSPRRSEKSHSSCSSSFENEDDAQSVVSSVSSQSTTRSSQSLSRCRRRSDSEHSTTMFSEQVSADISSQDSNTGFISLDAGTSKEDDNYAKLGFDSTLASIVKDGFTTPEAGEARNSSRSFCEIEQQNISPVTHQDFAESAFSKDGELTVSTPHNNLGMSRLPDMHNIMEVEKPKLQRRRRIRNELASLLPPPVDVSKDLSLLHWSSTRTWELRNESEEEEIMWKFVKDGLDKEDQDYLEKMFHTLQSDGSAQWDRTLYWVPPRTVSPVKILERPKRNGRIENFFDDPELSGIVPHSSGCARAQGFYKLSHKQKRGVIRRPDLFNDKSEINEKEENAVRLQTHAARDARTVNRRLLYSMKDTSSDIFKVNQLKYRKKMIKFARSRIHGWGLYALEPIAPDDMIVEYVGQKVRPTVADEREQAYERRGMGSSYLFRIDNDTVIDATQMGNFARFINHSCQPNCYAKVVTVEGDKRIVIYSKVQINKGDEITYDYKFPIEDDKIDCLCGAPTCRGSLN